MLGRRVQGRGRSRRSWLRRYDRNRSDVECNVYSQEIASHRSPLPASTVNCS